MYTRTFVITGTLPLLGAFYLETTTSLGTACGLLSIGSQRNTEKSFRSLMTNGFSERAAETVNSRCLAIVIWGRF